ncbi:hypothetical protein B0H16DRAFT_222372 [Mycena metata]|uniref:Uncharacterized protein n=1 Tax=Mycena metata TaxID=1033252 RepID=A0AAD7HYW0_9AGAR|nr:hypothetical protein B0H16DRAFT_222372 [Mycena metata]
MPPNFPLCLPVSHLSHPPSPAIMSTRADACGCDITKWVFAREDTIIAGMDLGAGPNRGAVSEHGAFSFVTLQRPHTSPPRWSCSSESAPHSRRPLLQQAIAATSLTGSATAGQIFAFLGSKDTRRTGSAASPCAWSASSWWTQAAAAPPSRVLCRCRGSSSRSSRSWLSASSWWTQAAAAPPSHVLCRYWGSSSRSSRRPDGVRGCLRSTGNFLVDASGSAVADGIVSLIKSEYCECSTAVSLHLRHPDPPRRAPSARTATLFHYFRCLSITPGLAVSQCER